MPIEICYGYPLSHYCVNIFLNWHLNRTEACLYVDLRWQSLIALLHFYLVSTTIWIEGGQGCMDLLQWLSSCSRDKLIIELMVMEIFSIVSSMYF